MGVCHGSPNGGIQNFSACGELVNGIWGGGRGCRKFFEEKDGMGSDNAWDEWTVLGEGVTEKTFPILST